MCYLQKIRCYVICKMATSCYVLCTIKWPLLCAMCWNMASAMCYVKPLEGPQLMLNDIFVWSAVMMMDALVVNWWHGISSGYTKYKFIHRVQYSIFWLTYGIALIYMGLISRIGFPYLGLLWFVFLLGKLCERLCSKYYPTKLNSWDGIYMVLYALQFTWNPRLWHRFSSLLFGLWVTNVLETYI